jgi:hypothetical protein
MIRNVKKNKIPDLEAEQKVESSLNLRFYAAGETKRGKTSHGPGASAGKVFKSNYASISLKGKINLS